MANETTTTSANDVVQVEAVQPLLILALSERPGLAFRVCRKIDFTGQSGKSFNIPKQVAFWGTPGDRGAGVDTEFDGTEGTAVGNTQITTDKVTITPAEYVVAAAPTDTLLEDSFDGAQFIDMITGSMFKALTLAVDDDLCALFAGLSNSVGTTNTDLSIANMLDATQGIIDRGADCDAMEYTLDPEQVKNLRAAITATGTNLAVYANATDRFHGADPARGAARGAGLVMHFDGSEVRSSGLCDTDAGPADVIGAAFCPTTPHNDATGATTFGIGWKRAPRIREQYQAKGRSTDIVMSMRCGVVELQNDTGTAIETDMP